MRILAIDPGSERSAMLLLADGKPERFDIFDNAQVEAVILNCKFAAWKLPSGEIVALSPDRFVCEMIASYGMPVGREVFETCVWIGRFCAAAEQAGLRANRIYRKDEKMHLCHSMKATDANIRAALIDRFGPGREKAIGTKKAPGPLYGIHDDVWAALAVAVTYEEMQKPGLVAMEL